jgi:hypothetical protein
MIVYRVSYYDEGGGVEMHYPTKKEAIKVAKKIWGNEDTNSIHVEELKVVKPTRKNICFMLSGIQYIESRKTLISKGR